MQGLRIINTLQEMTDKIYSHTVKEYKLSKRDLEIIVAFLIESNFELSVTSKDESKFPCHIDNQYVNICPSLIN